MFYSLVINSLEKRVYLTLISGKFVQCIINIYFFFFISSSKHELPKLIAIGNKFINKDSENKSKLILQDQLFKCNKLIDALQQENIQQKAEVIFIANTKYQ